MDELPAFMAIETYQQALDFWYSRVNYEQRGMPTDLRELKLDRMRRLLDLLGRPHEELKIVHVAGSKGKGSTSAMLASVLRRAGYRTGLFTSPHLVHVSERIQVDGKPINSDELLLLMQEIEPAVLTVERQEGSAPTFFEIVTALGFMHFARRRTDLAVVEVGLGGRFDSTNVCHPLLSIITSISFDHTQQLGNTLARIAREKAGIIKPGRPTISGAVDEEAAAVIAATARRRNAPLHVLGRDFKYRYASGRVTTQAVQYPTVQIETQQRTWPVLDLGLHGPHQGANAAIVVEAIEQLRSQGIAVSDSAVADGLRHAEWPARVEVLQRDPLIVLDCAHNVASIASLLDTLKSTFSAERRALVFAGSRDKDLGGMLALLAPAFELALFTRYSSSQRGAEAEELAGMWAVVGGRGGEIHPTPAVALERARHWAGSGDLICVTGSVFLAGELRPLLAKP